MNCKYNIIFLFKFDYPSFFSMFRMNSDERNKVVPSDIRGARLDLEAAQREKLLNAKVAAKSLGQKSDELQVTNHF